MQKPDPSSTGMAPIGDLLKDISLPESLVVTRPKREPAADFDIDISKEDVTYTHPLFMQCFLPVRHNPSNALRWQSDNGKASIVIRAGELAIPGQPGQFHQHEVPAGAKGRLAIAYINHHIMTHRTLVIPLGETAREAMRKLGISIGGKNYAAMRRELENLAASTIFLGTWGSDGSARTDPSTFAKSISLWDDSNPEQRTFWQSHMVVSQEYYDKVLEGERMSPLYWPALIGLQENARAMDIHSYLVYTLRKPLTKPLNLSAKFVHDLFGQDIELLKNFWPRFKSALLRAHKYYPSARVSIKKDHTGIILKNSPPLIPYRKTFRLN